MPSVMTASAWPGSRKPRIGTTSVVRGSGLTADEATSAPAFLTVEIGYQVPSERIIADESPAATTTANGTRPSDSGVVATANATAVVAMI